MQPSDLQFINLNIIPKEFAHVFFDAGKLWKNADSTFPQHRFYYILSGKCTIRIAGKSYTGIPGRWFFIPAGVPCGYLNDCTKPFSKYWVHFDMIHSNTDLLSSLDLPPYVDAPLDKNLLTLFETGAAIRRSEMLSDKLQLSGVMFQLMSSYIRLSGDMTAGAFYEKDARSQQILQYIRRHLQDDLSNSTLAAYMHMDVRNFIRYFKKITGSTPAKYITLLRMSTAQTLLTETDMRISDIMYQVGIDDLPLFSKIFKRVYFLSPKAYREMYRKEN